MVEEKTVEFEHSTVTVNEEGEVVDFQNVDEYDRAIEALEDAGYEVDRAGEYAFFVGDDGDTFIENTVAYPTVFGILEDHDMEIRRMWPAYEDGDDTDLAMYISLE